MIVLSGYNKIVFNRQNYLLLLSFIHMNTSQLATKIDARVKKGVELVCKERGIKMNRFIEDALLDKLEEMGDIEELYALRREPSRPLSDILSDLKAHGKI